MDAILQVPNAKNVFCISEYQFIHVGGTVGQPYEPISFPTLQAPSEQQTFVSSFKETRLLGNFGLRFTTQGGKPYCRRNLRINPRGIARTCPLVHARLPSGRPH